MVDPRWALMTPSEWDAFAEAWLSELRGLSTHEDVGQAVVLMNFTAAPEQQWQFICAAVSKACSDEELGHIAAGPLEHLLGKHGVLFIDRVETTAAADPTFARMLTGAWQHMMTAEVWRRVQAIQATVREPLRPPTDAPVGN